VLSQVELAGLEPDGGSAKALGAFYTAQEVADFLVWWAVRSRDDRVIDPSFGGGAFLRSACKRLRALKGDPSTQIYGVEIDAAVYGRISEKLAEEFGVRRHHLFRLDFFAFDTDSAPVNVVVGNPPFIRYQRFTGDARALALACAARAGVRLSELTSSWAPFLIHSIELLQPGGRLAMVVPAELAYAAYARPVLEHLRATFATVSVATFRGKLFPELSEDTFLLLAEGKGSGPAAFGIRDFAHAGALARFQHRRMRPRFEPIDAPSDRNGIGFNAALLPAETRALYRELGEATGVCPLGELADVGIGYVTGANEFFHLDAEQIRRRAIPASFLRPAVRNGRCFQGLRLTHDDWRAAGEAHLLALPADAELPVPVRDYLQEGERQGVPSAYKCRTRSPWYRVPHVYLPDGFLTYMSGAVPRLVANDAGAVAPNTLHILRSRTGSPLDAMSLSAAWLTSVSRLSAEVEGHSLGGGMLKLEPTEAERVLVPDLRAGLSTGLPTEEIDALLRSGRQSEAEETADRVILRDGLGLSRKDCALLRKGAELLRDRRYARSGR
jgi:adenine-specific DNA-methyltransferase